MWLGGLQQLSIFLRTTSLFFALFPSSELLLVHDDHRCTGSSAQDEKSTKEQHRIRAGSRGLLAEWFDWALAVPTTAETARWAFPWGAAAPLALALTVGLAFTWWSTAAPIFAAIRSGRASAALAALLYLAFGAAGRAPALGSTAAIDSLAFVWGTAVYRASFDDFNHLLVRNFCFKNELQERAWGQ